MIAPRPHLEPIHRTPDDTESRLPFLRLDMNERIVPFPESLMQKLREAVTADVVMSYPELEPLYQTIAARTGVDRDELFLVPGSDTGIRTVYETYIDPGQIVVLHEPTFAMHDVYSRMYQAQVRPVPYNSRLELDVDRYLDAITPDTRMVVVESPNGFTGTALPVEAIRIIVEKAHAVNALALLDEAYYLFSGQTVQPLYREFDNVIITRSFSKDLGLAGLRCGYLLSQPQNINSIFKVKAAYGVSSLTAVFAKVLLDHPEEMAAFVTSVQAGLAHLMAGLRGLGLVTVGGRSNFVVTYLGETVDIPRVIAHLREQHMLVRRPFRVDSLRGWLRIGGGSVNQMDRFISEFGGILHAAGWRADSYAPPDGVEAAHA
jgi:histidinol-phosphate aminotransferase